MPGHRDVQGPWVLRIHELATQEPQSTPHDGRFVKEYDSHQDGDALIRAHLVTTADPRQAQQFSTREDAVAALLQDRGIRAHDGRPDRPLTAYTVEILHHDDAVAEFG